MPRADTLTDRDQQRREDLQRRQREYLSAYERGRLSTRQMVSTLRRVEAEWDQLNRGRESPRTVENRRVVNPRGESLMVRVLDESAPVSASWFSSTPSPDPTGWIADAFESAFREEVQAEPETCPEPRRYRGDRGGTILATQQPRRYRDRNGRFISEAQYRQQQADREHRRERLQRDRDILTAPRTFTYTPRRERPNPFNLDLSRPTTREETAIPTTIETTPVLDLSNLFVEYRRFDNRDSARRFTAAADFLSRFSDRRYSDRTLMTVRRMAERLTEGAPTNPGLRNRATWNDADIQPMVFWLEKPSTYDELTETKTGGMLGMVVTIPDEDKVRTVLAVHGAARRQGVGGKLLREAQQFHGAMLQVFVHRSNTPALMLALKEGFQPDSVAGSSGVVQMVHN